MALPGTHSKWVQVSDGRIARFATYMTGELFAVLSRHSILGRLMPEDEGTDAQARDAAFTDGVNAARNGSAGDLAHQIFATRTLGLTRRLPAEALKDYLSGLLIGSELVSGLALMRNTLARHAAGSDRRRRPVRALCPGAGCPGRPPPLSLRTPLRADSSSSPCRRAGPAPSPSSSDRTMTDAS